MEELSECTPMLGRPGPAILEMVAIIGGLTLLLSLGSIVALPGGIEAALGSGGILLAIGAAWWSMRARRVRWADYGLKRPASWPKTLALALAATAATLVIVGMVIQPLILLIPGVEPGDWSRFEFMRGNLPAFLSATAMVWVTAAFGEEMLMRGYFMHRVQGLISGAKGSWAIAVIVQAVVFGFMHIYQGTAGIVLTGSVGLVFGVIYLAAKRNMVVTILAHGLIDTISFLAFYLGVAPGGAEAGAGG